jgi:hypothetical protein
MKIQLSSHESIPKKHGMKLYPTNVDILLVFHNEIIGRLFWVSPFYPHSTPIGGWWFHHPTLLKKDPTRWGPRLLMGYNHGI